MLLFIERKRFSYYSIISKVNTQYLSVHIQISQILLKCSLKVIDFRTAQSIWLSCLFRLVKIGFRLAEDIGLGLTGGLKVRFNFLLYPMDFL